MKVNVDMPELGSPAMTVHPTPAQKKEDEVKSSETESASTESKTEDK